MNVRIQRSLDRGYRTKVKKGSGYRKKKTSAAKKKRRRLILIAAIFALLVVIGIIYPYYSVHGCSGIAQDAQNIMSTVSAMISDNPVTTPEPDMYGPYRIRRVVDGDTVVIRLEDTDFYIRLLGIDAPESVSYNTSENCKEGEVSAAFTKKILSRKNVYLEYDKQTTDKYGRILAYVYLDDKKTMANEEILRAGMAKVYILKPNVKHEKEFREIEKEAKRTQTGHWGSYYH